MTPFPVNQDQQFTRCVHFYLISGFSGTEMVWSHIQKERAGTSRPDLDTSSEVWCYLEFPFHSASFQCRGVLFSWISHNAVSLVCVTEHIPSVYPHPLDSVSVRSVWRYSQITYVDSWHEKQRMPGLHTTQKRKNKQIYVKSALIWLSCFDWDPCFPVWLFTFSFNLLIFSHMMVKHTQSLYSNITAWPVSSLKITLP